jgi:glycogen operon protein
LFLSFLISSWKADRPGATVTKDGVGFAIRAPHAERVLLSIFEEGHEHQCSLPDRTGDLHHGLVAGLGPGAQYGFRVEGRWEPEAGIFSNPAKLLLDPYGRRLTGGITRSPALVTHRPGFEDRPDGTDSAPYVPRSVVVGGEFDWGGDRPPATPWADTVFYETHVKGFTKRHPLVQAELRGTYPGLTTKPVIEHLLSLGVTAVELLPIHASLTEAWLQPKGLTNYWGYSTIGFFAPDERFAAGTDPVTEFKQMVAELHRHGLEVILDVVYNHTAEGNQVGATLCFRGLDNPGFYHLDPSNRRRYLDYAGTGNTIDLSSDWPRSLVLDSLRYWVTEMHVDGFRFDLATALGRAPDRFDPGAAFFAEVAADPIISGVKLIAEPWDLGPDGYQVGEFPPGWVEWNGRYRDAIRDVWRSTDITVDDLASRLTGSSDLFGNRGPLASVNFVTCHDGFTLTDLVSYNDKHNQANGEDNRDGEAHNRSWNSGGEGPSDDPVITDLRRRRAGSLLATLFLSQGVPLLLGGDELGRTQVGNNNAYCQDNETSWFDWDQVDSERLRLVQDLAALRRRCPMLRRVSFPTGPVESDDLGEVGWYTPLGRKMTPPDWGIAWVKTLGVFLSDQSEATPRTGLYVMVNASAEVKGFHLPEPLATAHWSQVLATGPTRTATDGVELESFSLAVFEAIVG